MKEPILITGCARSGTSMTAGIINIGGAFGGKMYGPNQFNQKGMFENRAIREEIIRPYLANIGVDPKGQRPLPNNRQVFKVSRKESLRLRRDVQSRFIDQGLKGETPWFIKEPKMNLVWYIWHLAFPGAKWVVVRRKDEDIIRSCQKTRFMTAYHDDNGWQAWIDSQCRRFREMLVSIPATHIQEFWPSTMVEGNFSKAKELVEWLGLEWKDRPCRAFIDPQLYKDNQLNRVTAEDLAIIDTSR